MEKIIKSLKQTRDEAERTFIEMSLIKRASLIDSPVPDTDSYLDDIAELNEAISVLENHSMQKCSKATQ